MNKKRLLTAVFILALLFLMIVVTQFVYFAVANPNPFKTWTFKPHPIISIHLPLGNETYGSNGVLVEFTITKPENGWGCLTSRSGEVFNMQLLDVRVIIDGKFYEKFPAYDYLSSPFSCHKNLTNLENGAHNLKITAVCIGLELEEMPWTIRYLTYDVSSDLIVFTVDATSPSVSVLSPENASCELTGNLLDAPLNFTVNEPVSRLTYSLDGQKNVTVAGNTTLANLPYGAHNVTVYATDNVGNIGFETVIFTIAEPQPEPFQTAPIAPTSGALMAILGVGLMVYLKKHKR